ncbi:sigma-54-dependent transcriptional regulator [Limnoglobus roseus]|uniref:Sigma-54-dependent Fis family transcriptional regulator n=1 Tax=Limnoglobus roseus TaxID=2598579 RepID=A0A5C1AB80_9BACT|nr:sigma-54 dependent transcriptional regulator [Limnoglobus roseus]QEL16491.1 sigma-54-dependent Fis family transcriptional regulator [Limnoglobus roseus]
MIAKPEPASVLIVDDEPLIRETLAEYLQQQSFRVATAENGEVALANVRKRAFDVVICDINLPGLDGLEVLERLSRSNPETFVLLITAYATVDSAVEAFQKGASDYLMKPILLHEVSQKIRRLMVQKSISQENQWLRRELNRQTDAADMVVGRSPAMQAAVQLARKVGPTPSTVLLLGESGTGKKLMARTIHRAAQPAKGPEKRFVAVNCAATPGERLENQLFGHCKGAYAGADADQAGLFAQPGTVFLDEIGELSPGTQAKLLRAIEQHEILPIGANEPVPTAARLIAATNKDLQQEVAAGRFREDLLYRLNTVTILLPPLRERREDIPEFVEHLVAKHAGAMSKRFAGANREAMELLVRYPWKGNVRELDNAIQRAIILGDGPLIRPTDLSPDIAPDPADPSAVDDLNAAAARFEKQHIERILRQTPDKREAAKRLGIGLSSLYRKIEQLGIGPGER